MADHGITIDGDALRRDLKNDCMGAYFGGGYGAALADAFDVDTASPEELLAFAQRLGRNIYDYQLD